MGCTIDHLESFHRFTVIQEFTDLRGVHHRLGESGVIQLMELDWAKEEIRIHWDRNKKRETLVFALKATEGPRNGHMKEFFEKAGFVAPETPGKKFVEGFGMVSTTPPTLPELENEEPEESGIFARVLGMFSPAPFVPKPSGSPEVPTAAKSLVRGADRCDEAIQRVWALAGRKRFVEAEEQLLAIERDPYSTARSLTDLAERHAFEEDGAVYEWLKEKATNHWYAWGSTATSGGEGAERMLHIGPAMERFKKLDQYRTSIAPKA